MSITTRLGIKRRAHSMASLPSATCSTAKPPASNTSQNSFRLRSLSSTTRILFVICDPRCFRPHGSASAKPYLLNGCLTILHSSENSVTDASGLALPAHTWVLSDTPRPHRFLPLTRAKPDALPSALGESGTHLPVRDCLCAHEPARVAAANALDLDPADLAAARERLAR